MISDEAIESVWRKFHIRASRQCVRDILAAYEALPEQVARRQLLIDARASMDKPEWGSYEDVEHLRSAIDAAIARQGGEDERGT